MHMMILILLNVLSCPTTGSLLVPPLPPGVVNDFNLWELNRADGILHK